MRIDDIMKGTVVAGAVFSGAFLVTLIGHITTRAFHRDHGLQEIVTDFGVGAVMIGSAYACHKLMQVMRAERVR